MSLIIEPLVHKALSNRQFRFVASYGKPGVMFTSMNKKFTKKERNKQLCYEQEHVLTL